MLKKSTLFLAVIILILTAYSVQAQPTAYVFHGGVFRYGTINLNNGTFTSLNFYPQGSSLYPATADNISVDEQLAIMSDFSYPPNYSLWNVNFTALTGTNIATVGPLAAGQILIKGMAYNVITDTWYVISGDDIGSAAYLYTLNIATGVLTVVGQLQNANIPVAMAINCDGNAYLVNVLIGASTTPVLCSLNLSTAVATQIGTNLGLANVSTFGQDMDFNPDDGSLYWAGYWIAGFNEGGSFRIVDVNSGTSTELAAYGPFQTLTGFSINGNCSGVPVELTSFTANVNNNTVVLQWSTASETNNSGFGIERMNGQSEWENIGFIPGFGTTTEPHSYSFTDAQLAAGSYTYRLKQVNFDGTFEYSHEVEVEVVSPTGYMLSQNYPNPFNPSTTIEFTIPSDELVNVSVYNSLGEKVAELVNEVLSAGNHTVEFNADGLTTGIYLVKMSAGSFESVRKMNLLK